MEEKVFFWSYEKIERERLPGRSRPFCPLYASVHFYFNQQHERWGPLVAGDQHKTNIAMKIIDRDIIFFAIFTGNFFLFYNISITLRLLLANCLGKVCEKPTNFQWERKNHACDSDPDWIGFSLHSVDTIMTF